MQDSKEYTPNELASLLPFPPEDANKYTRGKLIAVVGSARFPGAAALVACAAERMGAGYTQVFTSKSVLPLVRASSASLVVDTRKKLSALGFDPPKPGNPRAYVVGSGFDAQAKSSASLVYRVLTCAPAAVLVDGGGLDALATKQGRALLKRRFVRNLPTVITPHAGEAARLAKPLGLSTHDQPHLALQLSLAYGVVVVLKGPCSYVSDGDVVVRISAGTSALAKAGTGDVLAGMVGALLAQGVTPVDAAVLGATLHGYAGRAAAQKVTSFCVCAQDVIEGIALACAQLLEGDVCLEIV